MTKSKVKCNHCETQKSPWCKSQGCEHYGQEQPEQKKSAQEKQTGIKLVLAKMGKIPRKVICLDTNKIYDSAQIAAEEVKVVPGSIRDCCNSKYWTAGGKRWAWADEVSIDRLEPRPEPKKRTYNIQGTPVIHIPTKTRYESVREAAKRHALSESGVYYHLRRNALTYPKKKFIYAGDADATM